MPVRSSVFPSRYMRYLADYVRDAMRDAPGDWRFELNSLLTRPPGETISFIELEKIVEAVKRQTGRVDMGFEVGRKLNFDSHGALGIALGRCGTVDQALRLVSRYFDLVTPSFVMRYERDTAVGRIVYRPMSVLSPMLLRVVLEMHAVAFHTQFSTLMGARLQSYDIHLFMEPPRHAARYELLAPARVHFGGMTLPEAHIEIATTQLDLPLTGAEARSGGVLLGIDRLGAAPAAADEWSDWVIMIMREAEETMPTLNLLAHMLSVAPRTLRRHLAKEGNTYRDLARVARYERACRWLADPVNSVTNIAFRLGYRDATNFSRAFRQETGMAPRAWRKNLYAGSTV